MRKFNLKQGLLTAFLCATSVSFGQGVCNQFSYFYADITYPDGGEQTDIYDVELSGNDANLNLITSINFGVHIAFNESNGLLYAVNDNNGEISIIDPSTGILNAPTPIDQSISSLTTAAFNAEGILLLGSHNGNIYQVDDLSANPIAVSLFSENNDISGGDITFNSEGNLYLAAKPQGKLYEVIPGFANPLLGNVDGQVTGMATMENGEDLIVSSRNNNEFFVYQLDTTVIQSAAFSAKIDGQPFTLGNGDMTSGCTEQISSLDNCDDFRTYYIHNAEGAGPVILYQVDFNSFGGATLTELTELTGGSHLGVGQDGFLYIVRHNTGLLTKFNPVTLGVENEVQINLNGENIANVPAVAVGNDGFLYVGSGPTDLIYKVDPNTGDAEIYGEGNVSGGDLVFVGDALWLANRNQGRFYEINGDGQFDVDAEEINGVSALPDGKLLIANGNLSGLFEVYDPTSGAATGEVFETGLALFNGDLASRCFDGQSLFQSCGDFRTYFIHTPIDGVDAGLYSASISDLGTIDFEFIRTTGDGHLGVGPDGLLYVVGDGELSIIDPLTNVSVEIPILNEEGSGLGGIPAVVVGDDGVLYIGSGPQNKIYTVDTSTGTATYFADAQVQGGDLVFIDGELWVANRHTAEFTNVITDSTFSIAAQDILGVSALPDGNLLVANGDFGSTFDVYEPITGDYTGVSYETGFELYWGDLASRCFDDGVASSDCQNFNLFLSTNGALGGDIYSVTLDGGSATLDLLLEGLGNPHLAFDEGNGQLYIVKDNGEIGIYDPVTEVLSAFTTITYTGAQVDQTFAAVVTNDGKLLVGSGSVNTVYEVDPVSGIATNPTDVPVAGGDLVQTEDGDVWVVNRGHSRFYNITDGTTEFDIELNDIYGAALMQNGSILVGSAGNELHVVDPITKVMTGTTYELDFDVYFGDLAGGCSDNYQPIDLNEEAISVNLLGEPSTLDVYPNPAEDITNIEVQAAKSERAVMEIFDLSGRSVAHLLGQDVKAGQTYRMVYDASDLTNGIYVIKYVTNSETVIEKIMINR